MKPVPALSSRGAKVLAAAGQKLIKVGQWSSSAIYGNPTRARHRQRVVALKATHACTKSTAFQGEKKKRKGGKFMLFSNHNGSLLRQQPKAGCFEIAAVCRSMLLCADLCEEHASSVRLHEQLLGLAGGREGRGVAA